MQDHPIVADLRRTLRGGAVVTDVDMLASYAHDAAALCEWHMPLAAVLPSNESEVQEIVRVAAAHQVSLVAQGALTGLAGAANAVPNCVAVSSRRMNRILDIDEENGLAVVEPGVTNGQLREAAAQVGLTYRPDPSSWESSTIGGNIATNAGGLCCVKYGVTSRFVRGLRVVLADGRAVRVGRQTVKGVAGLNLTDLFVGSEGTLGFVTQATLALDSTSADPLTLAATFPDASTASQACTSIRKSGIRPSLFELLDRTTLTAINAFAQMGFDHDAGALLIVQTDSGPAASDEIAKLAELCQAGGATDLAVAEDSLESEQLIQARRLAYPAMEALGPTLVDDVAVPLSQVGRLIDEVEDVARKHGLMIGVVGHAGDGNLHPTVVVEADNPASLEAAHLAFDEIAEVALSLGGTITGEHGVGLLKRDLLEKELDPVAAELQRSIKELLDPEYLFNPGKVLSAPARRSPTTTRPEGTNYEHVR